MARTLDAKFGGDSGPILDGPTGVTVGTRSFGTLRLTLDAKVTQSDAELVPVAQKLALDALKQLIPRAPDVATLSANLPSLSDALAQSLNATGEARGIHVEVPELQVTVPPEDLARLRSAVASALPVAPAATGAPPAAALPPVAPPPPTPPAAVVAPSSSPTTPVTPPPVAPAPAAPSISPGGGWGKDLDRGAVGGPPPEVLSWQTPSGLSFHPAPSAPTAPSPGGAPPAMGPGCAACHAPLAANAHFCPACGAKVA